MADSEVTCTKTAWVRIVRNDFNRVELRILNTDGTNAVNIAKDGSTPPGAALLATDELITKDPRRAYFCYAPTAAVTVSVVEGYTELGEVSRSGTKKGILRSDPPTPPPPPSNGGGPGPGTTRT